MGKKKNVKNLERRNRELQFTQENTGYTIPPPLRASSVPLQLYDVSHGVCVCVCVYVSRITIGSTPIIKHEHTKLLHMRSPDQKYLFTQLFLYKRTL